HIVGLHGRELVTQELVEAVHDLLGHRDSLLSWPRATAGAREERAMRKERARQTGRRYAGHRDGAAQRDLACERRRIDLDPPEVEAACRAQDGRHARRGGMYVENFVVRLLFKDFLHELGHEVMVAPDRPRALDVASGFEPELALLDIGLPVMDGYELARQLRGLPGLGGAFLVA